jgi:hypothetical protein
MFILQGGRNLRISFVLSRITEFFIISQPNLVSVFIP